MPRQLTSASFFLWLCLLSGHAGAAPPLLPEEIIKRFIRFAVPEQRQTAILALDQLRKGQLESAARAVDELSKGQSEIVGGITPAQLSQLAEHLRTSIPTQSKPVPARSGLQDLKLRVSQFDLLQIPIGDRPIVKALENASTGTPYINFVQTRVKQFFKAYAQGARNPDEYLRRARSTHPQVVSRWEGTPLDRRIFLVGAGKDDPFVRNYIHEQEKDGYTVFFYKDCEHTAFASCDDAVVGAFMASASRVLALVSSASEASLFCSPETVFAQRFRAGRKLVIMISPANITSLAEEVTRTAFIVQQKSQ